MIIGTSGKRARSVFRRYGLSRPLALPIGEAHGITTWQPTSISRPITVRSSVQ